MQYNCLIRLPEVCRRVGLSAAEVYRLQARRDFPQSVPLGVRARAWAADEVESWINDRIAARKPTGNVQAAA